MLKDAKGFRSPYINALNAAVKAQRVVGGDVVPQESASGTLLFLEGTRRAHRFELFFGFDTEEAGSSGAVDAYCLGDGTLYVAAVPVPLVPGRDVYRRETGLAPRGSGWCTHKVIEGEQTLEWLCCRYQNEWYIVARKTDPNPENSEKLEDLLPEDLGPIQPGEVERVFSFGDFHIPDPSGQNTVEIRQYVRSDVYYGGAGQTETVQPFTLRIRLDKETIPPENEGDEPTTKETAYLDIFDPQGVRRVLLNANLDTETEALEWADKRTELSGGWYTFGRADDALPWAPSGTTGRDRSFVFVQFPEDGEGGFYVLLSDVRPTQEAFPRSALIGTIYRTDNPPDEEGNPPETEHSYSFVQANVGTFDVRNQWEAQERVFVALGGSSEDFAPPRRCALRPRRLAWSISRWGHRRPRPPPPAPSPSAPTSAPSLTATQSAKALHKDSHPTDSARCWWPSSRHRAFNGRRTCSATPSPPTLTR